MASKANDGSASKDADESIIHERQSLQLCAVHAINNLLQISTDGNNEGWMCGSCNKLNEQPSWTRATKTELDEIADALTIAESQLMVEDNDGNNYNVPPQAISLYQKLSSQHRTVLFGRYSFEVMQMALKRRNVNLSWFSPSQTGNVESLLHVNDSEDESSQIVIGFIVNNVNKTSIWTRMPLVSRWYGDGRHWFAITGLQRIASSNNNNDVNKWKVLDSMIDEPILLDSDLELLELLTSIVENGGNVFRAAISI